MTVARTRAALAPGLPPALACLGLLLAWELTSRLLSTGGMPDVVSTVRELPMILGDREALIDIASSLRRMALGFAIALAIGAPIGLLMGRIGIVANLLNPLMMLTYPVPKAALMPIIMLWFGVGDASKLLVIVLGVSLPIIYHAYQGALAVEEKMIWSAQAMGLSAPRRMLRVVLPAALPEILVGCRTGIVLALITMVTSEMIARQTGAGNILFNALDMAQYETVYAMILVIGALGILLDVAFERVRTSLTSWSDARDDFAVSPL